MKKAQLIHIKEEIRMLYKKKDKLNRDLYKTHLQAAKDWGKTWYLIQNSIQNSLNVEIEKKYKTNDDKINKMTLTQTDEEMSLLKKGPKYNLSYKRKHWISNLALEAANAIMLLPIQEQDYIRYQVAYNLEKLYKQQREKHIHNNRISTHEYRIANQLKNKLN
jgi:hypothetical protein